MEKNDSDIKFMRFTIDIDVKDHRQLKIASATYGKSMRDIVVQSIKNVIEDLKRGE